MSVVLRLFARRVPIELFWLRVAWIWSKEGSVEVPLPVELVAGRIAVVTMTEPDTTPTTFTREVSWIPMRAQRLDMKLLSTVLLKKSFTLMAKWVVSCTLSVRSTSTRQFKSSVTTKCVV